MNLRQIYIYIHIHNTYNQIDMRGNTKFSVQLATENVLHLPTREKKFCLKTSIQDGTDLLKKEEGKQDCKTTTSWTPLPV